jgi:hydrogenase-4 component E
VLPLLGGPGGLGLRAWFLAGTVLVLKGIAFPLLLRRAQRGANVRREIEPYVGYTLSLGGGLAALGFSFWMSSRLPLPPAAVSELLVPFALFTFLVGLFLITTRKKALTQVIGYLTMENGIYAFGIGTAIESPLLVELGCLLDVFVAVFVMGIIIFHISREFDHIDTDRLASLRDWRSGQSSRAGQPPPEAKP